MHAFQNGKFVKVLLRGCGWPLAARKLADRVERAQNVTLVCTGALVLGAAGLLKGYRATTHWAALETLTECGATPAREDKLIPGRQEGKEHEVELDRCG